MKSFEVCTILFFLGAVIFPGICAEAAPENSSSIASLSTATTINPHADLVSFVDNAVAYARANGKEKAINEFNNNKSAEFIKGERHIFANDFMVSPWLTPIGQILWARIS
jgi:hypothetical protein